MFHPIALNLGIKLHSNKKNGSAGHSVYKPHELKLTLFILVNQLYMD